VASWQGSAPSVTQKKSTHNLKTASSTCHVSDVSDVKATDTLLAFPGKLSAQRQHSHNPLSQISALMCNGDASRQQCGRRPEAQTVVNTTPSIATILPMLDWHGALQRGSPADLPHPLQAACSEDAVHALWYAAGAAGARCHNKQQVTNWHSGPAGPECQAGSPCHCQVGFGSWGHSLQLQ